MKPKVATFSEKLYYCNLCDYYTSRKFNMQKHLKNAKHCTNETEKHKKTTIQMDPLLNENISCIIDDKKNETMKTKKQPVSQAKTECCRHCNQLFKSKATRWRHEKFCNNRPNIEFESNMIIEELKKDKEQLLKTISEMAPKIGNRINIQVFLNEECKNAMNFADFIESIPLTLNDLEYTYKNGKLEGVSNVIIKELEVMGKTERPLHCNKNNTIYVKDKDEWQEDVNNAKLKTTIETVENDHLKLIQEWEQSNEGWMDDDKLRTEYLDLVKTVMPNLQDKEKRQIINKISKIIKI